MRAGARPHQGGASRPIEKGQISTFHDFSLSIYIRYNQIRFSVTKSDRCGGLSGTARGRPWPWLPRRRRSHWFLAGAGDELCSRHPALLTCTDKNLSSPPPAHHCLSSSCWFRPCTELTRLSLTQFFLTKLTRLWVPKLDMGTP